MSTHHFNINVAKMYGVNESIILQNISFWQAKNEANEKNFHDGKYWVYNSVKAFSALFPYWSKGQINRILNKLEDLQVLSVGNYNKVNYDRTKWYSVNQEIHLLISGNGVSIIEKPIPDNKPDSKPFSEREHTFKELVKQTWAELGGEDFLPNIDAQKFFLYWSESNGKKMLFERQKTFCIKKRFKRWQLNNFNQSKPQGRNNA